MNHPPAEYWMSTGVYCACGAPFVECEIYLDDDGGPRAFTYACAATRNVVYGEVPEAARHFDLPAARRMMISILKDQVSADLHNI